MAENDAEKVWEAMVWATLERDLLVRRRDGF